MTNTSKASAFLLLFAACGVLGAGDDSATGPRVYYADDSATGRTEILGVLDGRGWSVWGVSSGEALVSLVDANTPAVIVTDHQMPGITGLDLCEKYKNQIPIIVVSGVDLGTARDRQLRDAVRKLGCVFVAKRNLRRDLPSVVKKALAQGATHARGY